MKNPNDYAAGWTKRVINPKTGKTCFGGAARNFRTAESGGIENIKVDTFLKAMEYVKPVIDQYQTQLAQCLEIQEKMQKQMVFLSRSNNLKKK